MVLSSNKCFCIFTDKSKSMINKKLKLLSFFIFLIFSTASYCQVRAKEINWTPDGTAYLKLNDGNIIRTEVKTNAETIIVKKEQLVPTGAEKPLPFKIYSFSPDFKTLLIFTNTAKVWRYNTRCDYWVLDVSSNQLTQLGKGLPSQSLMFAKT